MNFLEAQKQLCRELSIEFDKLDQNDRFSLPDIKEYINSAAKTAWDRHRWSFTEGQFQGTLTAAEISKGYVMYPDEMVVGSLTELYVEGIDRSLDKLRHQDYKRLRRQAPNRDFPIFSEYKNNIYINPNIISAGKKLEGYGKEAFTKMTADDDLLPFSHAPESESTGNDQIINLAYGEALGSDKLKEDAKGNNEQEKALALLDAMWKDYADDRAHEKITEPMLRVPDYFNDHLSTPNNRSWFGQFNI